MFIRINPYTTSRLNNKLTYVAQGNVMAIYRGRSGYVDWSEQVLYGSSRLGIWQYGKARPGVPPSVTFDSMMTGSTTYELTNHLGNVLTTISDKKVGHSSNGATVDYYRAVVLNQTNYYSGGMQMPVRRSDSLLFTNTFDAGTDGWAVYNVGTLQNDNGRLKFTGTVAWSAPKKALTLEEGRQYRIRFTIDMGNCSDLHVPVYKSDISSYVVMDGVGISVTASGSYEGTFTATSNNMLLLIEMIPGVNPPPGSAGYYWIDDVSLERLGPVDSIGVEYRYGFNGQEKSTEINSSGNLYTAKFWEYDSRIVRRWNRDPIIKFHQSDYVTFSDNPVWKLDPYGDDDYFNSRGQLIKQTKTGSKIYVQTVKGNLLLTEIKLNSAINRQTVANIVGYYANKIGIIFQPRGSDQNRGKGIVGLGWGKKDPEDNPAYTVNPSKDILINKRGNKINSDFFDYNNLQNTLIHEKLHKENIEKKTIENLQTHIDVYLGQIKDQTFRNGTESYQKGIIGSLGNYILNYFTDFTYGNTDQLDKYIEQFNETNKAGYFIQADVSSANERGYKINIFKDKKLTSIINYSKLTDDQGREK